MLVEVVSEGFVSITDVSLLSESIADVGTTVGAIDVSKDSTGPVSTTSENIVSVVVGMSSLPLVSQAVTVPAITLAATTTAATFCSDIKGLSYLFILL